MTKSTPQYVLGHEDTEMKRLQIQHEWLKSGTAGKLILAPMDMAVEDMNVLDSGTADGYWLKDVSRSLPASTKYVGSDIAQHAFPNATDSDGALFFCQSILDPWPRYLQSSFDLVHQRLVMATCNPTQSVEVLQRLVQLAKPGGWVHLMETDFQSNLPDDLPAGTRFRQMMSRSLSGLGFSPGQGSKLKGWLKDLSMVQVDEHVVDIGVGARSPDPSMKLATIENIMTVIEGMQKANKERAIPGLDWTNEDFETLKREYRDELLQDGGCQRFFVVYGQRPAKGSIGQNGHTSV